MKNKLTAVITALMLMVISCVGGISFTAAAADGSSEPVLTVRSQSNFFDDDPSVSYAKDTVPKQVTVDYYLAAPKFKIINGQYTLRYDPSVLAFNEDSNIDEDEDYTVSPVANGLVCNFDNENGVARFNFSNGESPKRLVKSSGVPVPVIHLVFDVVGKGDTTVFLDVYKQTFTDLVPSDDYNDWYTFFAEDDDKGEGVKSMFRESGAEIYTKFSPDYSFPPGEYIYGDVNLDGIVDITDATIIQLHIAGKEKMRLKGLAAFLADVDGNGLIDITDATFVQLYSNDSSRELKLTGSVFTVTEPDPQKPTEAPATQKPTTAPATQKPTEAPSTQKPTDAPSGRALTVIATSNIFPQAYATFDPVADQVTVTWWINLTADKMVNTQFSISYDNRVLEFDKTDGVNQEYDEDVPNIVSKSLIFRATKGVGTIVNAEPESMPNGGIKGNASKINGFKLTNAEGRVPFVSVTFKPKENAEGITAVNLDVEVMQLGNANVEAYYFIDRSKIVNSDISYLPNDTASAVYAGTFDGSRK